MIADHILSLVVVCLVFVIGVISLIRVGIECSKFSSFELSTVDYIPDLDNPIVDLSNKRDPENILRDLWRNVVNRLVEQSTRSFDSTRQGVIMIRQQDQNAMCRVRDEVRNLTSTGWSRKK